MNNQVTPNQAVNALKVIDAALANIEATRAVHLDLQAYVTTVTNYIQQQAIPETTTTGDLPKPAPKPAAKPKAKKA